MEGGLKGAGTKVGAEAADADCFACQGGWAGLEAEVPAEHWYSW